MTRDFEKALADIFGPSSKDATFAELTNKIADHADAVKAALQAAIAAQNVAAEDECTGVKMACAAADKNLGDVDSALRMYSAQNVEGVDVVAKKIRSAILFEIANAGYEDAADYIAGQYILEVIKEKLSLHAQSRQAVAEYLCKDDQEQAVWQAIQDITFCNKTDDKMIVANLHKAGFYIAAAPDAGEVG